MKYILGKSQRPTLATFALSNVLVAFDFDGTLAPIVERPHRARMRASTRRLLARVATSYPCVVISGRALNDITGRVDEAPVWHVFGNHGLEPGDGSVGHTRQARRWMRHLQDTLAGQHGVVVEDKGCSLTVHYRAAVDKRAARRAIQSALVGIKGARVFAGKQAVNIAPRSANKGSALEQARRLVACDTAIYVGDDGTDEDAFSAGPPHRLLSIRVGRARRSRATHYLTGQREIDALMRTLIALRAVTKQP